MSLPRRQSRLTAEQVIDEIYRDQDSDDEDFDSTNSSVSLRELDNSEDDYSTDEEEDDVLQSGEDHQHGDDVVVPRGRGRGRGQARGRGRGQARGRGRGQQIRGRGGQRGRQARRPERTWLDNADQFRPSVPEFQGNPGVKVDVTNFKPADFFALYINDDLLNNFVIQTNLYAEEYIRTTEIPPSSRVHRWVETDVGEMKTFIGLCLLMGVIKKPDYNSYWSTDPLIRTPVFSAAMPRDRFLLLLKFWHINDNRNLPPADEPGRDRLFKIRPLLDHLFEKFQEVFEPGRDIAIDESLLMWKGRLIFKQYIPLKRARFGIKSFLLCDSSGYTYRFRVYAGKDENTIALDENLPQSASTLGRSGKEVMHLMLPLLDKGYRLFVDNWYSSADLFELLLQHETSCCGTLRANRTPPCLRQLAVEKATQQAAPVTNCWPKSPTGDGVKPPANREYNLKMGAVDRHDQLLQPYDATRKTLKWYKKLAMRFMQIALLNAHIVAKKSGHSLTFLEFQKAVIQDLLFSSEATPDAGDDHSVRLVDRHFMDVIPPTEKKARPQKQCKVCRAKGTRRDTRYYCPDCPSKPGLCFPQCYKKYHTERFYWRN
ncbi:hypothetical protein RRG08_048882 [Elysia crispata]|uniref:Transposase n=1 Tax=Elysia crispata TaxID=231223 RepID=A0AAE0YUP9_9GAST|nr:hypothetical protein RRG08_048882 [Elysia crispata]